MYIRGELDPSQLGKEVGQVPLEEADHQLLIALVDEFATYFQADAPGHPRRALHQARSAVAAPIRAAVCVLGCTEPEDTCVEVGAGRQPYVALP